MTSFLLALETSCDDTSAAIATEKGILSHVTHSQRVHTSYNGVVPELASRQHQQRVVEVVRQTLQQAKLPLSALTAIGYTYGPGLLGPLLVGNAFAKGLALGLQLPLFPVNHLQAHVLANLIDSPRPAFPFLCLTVSGGHTQLVVAHSPFAFRLLGETRDDAMGEALDKAAVQLGLPYPGGPPIERHAQKGNPHAFTFAKATIPGLDFSFSGTKTAFRYFLQEAVKKDPDFITTHLSDICASLQYTLVNMVLDKVTQAVAQTGIPRVALAGGVAANQYLQDQLHALGAPKGWETFVPAKKYCTDNAAMIAHTAWYFYQLNYRSHYALAPSPRLSVENNFFYEKDNA